jgi:hypothetical protein
MAMIEILDGFPDTVVALSATGNVTRQDYDEVLVPAVEAALRRHDKVRIYYELGPRFVRFDTGAIWEDFKVGVGHWSRWGRVAVVSDIDWIRHAVQAFRFMMPDEARVFATGDAAAAREWVLD